MASEVPARIPATRRRLGETELRYARDCIESSWISSTGRFLDEFERGVAKLCGVRHAVACVNGTSALHLSLVALGVQPGDEVIVPALAGIAAANAVAFCGATPVFVDVDAASATLDPPAIAPRITPATKGIVAVHLYGEPADMDPILAIAGRHGLFVLEDARHALGARYDGRSVGGIGRCAAFSFGADRIVTTGEGGAVTTDDDNLARLLRLYRAQGMDPERRYWFSQIGYNYRLTNLAAAIGVAQLERAEEAVALRRQLAGRYDAALAGLAGRVRCPRGPAGAEPVYWTYPVQLEDAVVRSRDEVSAQLRSEGIQTVAAFRPLPEMPPYAHPDHAFPAAARCSARTIGLPMREDLGDGDVRDIVRALDRATR